MNHVVKGQETELWISMSKYHFALRTWRHQLTGNLMLLTVGWNLFARVSEVE